MSATSFPLSTPRRRTEMSTRSGPVDAPHHPFFSVPVNISVAASSSTETAPNVGGDTSDIIYIPVTMTPDGQDDMSVLSTHTVPTPAEMVITLPPDTNLTEFWEWIETSFANYYVPGLSLLMTKAFKCYTVTDLKLAVVTFNPASMIKTLGDTQYDSWWTPLVDLHELPRRHRRHQLSRQLV